LKPASVRFYRLTAGGSWRGASVSPRSMLPGVSSGVSWFYRMVHSCARCCANYMRSETQGTRMDTGEFRCAAFRCGVLQGCCEIASCGLWVRCSNRWATSPMPSHHITSKIAGSPMALAHTTGWHAGAGFAANWRQELEGDSKPFGQVVCSVPP